MFTNYIYIYICSYTQIYIYIYTICRWYIKLYTYLNYIYIYITYYIRYDMIYVYNLCDLHGYGLWFFDIFDLRASGRLGGIQWELLGRGDRGTSDHRVTQRGKYSLTRRSNMANPKLSIDEGLNGNIIWNLGIFNCNMFGYRRVCVVLMFSTTGFTCYLDFFFWCVCVQNGLKLLNV